MEEDTKVVADTVAAEVSVPGQLFCSAYRSLTSGYGAQGGGGGY